MLLAMLPSASPSTSWCTSRCTLALVTATFSSAWSESAWRSSVAWRLSATLPAASGVTMADMRIRASLWYLLPLLALPSWGVKKKCLSHSRAFKSDVIVVLRLVVSKVASEPIFRWSWRGWLLGGCATSIRMPSNESATLKLGIG